MTTHANSIATQIRTLFEELGPMTSGEIAARIDRPLNNVTRHISRLRADGYLVRLGDTKHRDGTRGRTFFLYALADEKGRPRIPFNLPIPKDWVVERELTGKDLEVYVATGPSPCYYCRHLERCRERVAALDDKPLPCFEVDA